MLEWHEAQTTLGLSVAEWRQALNQSQASCDAMKSEVAQLQSDVALLQQQLDSTREQLDSSKEQLAEQQAGSEQQQARLEAEKSEVERQLRQLNETFINRVADKTVGALGLEQQLEEITAAHRQVVTGLHQELQQAHAKLLAVQVRLDVPSAIVGSLT